MPSPTDITPNRIMADNSKPNTKLDPKSNPEYWFKKIVNAYSELVEII